MAEADVIVSTLSAIGRLHTRVDALGTRPAGTLNPSMLAAVDLAQTSAVSGLTELARLTREAVNGGSPTTTDSEAILQARAKVDQALSKLDAVLYDVVVAAET
jgi:hypothetical protein